MPRGTNRDATRMNDGLCRTCERYSREHATFTPQKSAVHWPIMQPQGCCKTPDLMSSAGPRRGSGGAGVAWCLSISPASLLHMQRSYSPDAINNIRTNVAGNIEAEAA